MAPSGRHRYLRSFEAGDRLETFLVSAIAAVLAIRFYLRLTGYPALGHHGIHLAHVLWGGFFMLVAIGILLVFLDRRAAHAASILGGIGFGTSLDELGKFVTRDNNYFFEPAVAMIYATFVLMFLAVRAVQSRRVFSAEECRANALQELEEAPHGLDRERRARVLDFLDRSNADDPLVLLLREHVAAATPAPLPREGAFAALRRRARAEYRRLSQWPGFPRLVTLFFAGLVGMRLVLLASAVFGGERAQAALLDGRLGEWLAARTAGLRFVDSAEIGSALIAAGLILIGIGSLTRSRLRAYLWFKRAVVVSIVLTQIFTFYREQLSALVDLGINLGILLFLQYAIAREATAPGRETRTPSEPARLEAARA